jgi:hypothetical protein
MVIYCVAFVGKYNEPLFVHVDNKDMNRHNMQGGDIDGKSDTLVYFEGIVHASIDIIEERRSRKSSAGGAQEMFLGQLLIVEDYRVFAWCSNTHTKTIIVCDVATSEAQVKDVLQNLYSQYVRAVQNPFQPNGQAVQLSSSKRFQSRIQQIVGTYNANNISTNNSFVSVVYH